MKLKKEKEGIYFLSASFGSHRKLFKSFLGGKYDIFSPKGKRGEKGRKMREFFFYLLVLALTVNFEHF